MSDDDVRAARKAHQSGEMTCSQLADLYQVGYRYMHSLLDYELRGNVLD